MAYSKQVVERFESVLKNPEKHSVGRFDPTDPDVASGICLRRSVYGLDLRTDSYPATSENCSTHRHVKSHVSKNLNP